MASESGLDARHDGWKAPARARVHALPQGWKSHEGHLSTAHTGGGVGPLPYGQRWEAATPHQHDRIATSSSSWPSSSSSVSPPSVSRLVPPSSELLALLLLRRLLLGHEITSFRGSFSSPSLRAAGARPAPARGARSARGRRTAAASTPP